VEERALWLAWAQIPGVGSILIQRLKQHFGTLAEAWQASGNELLAVEGVGLQIADTILTERQRLNPTVLLQQHEQANAGFWTPADPDYPQILLEIPDPPPVLYYRGKVNPMENRGQVPMVAIVGTRSPSDYGRRWTRRFASTLSQQGFSVVSGLAEGIDTEAHRSCIGVDGRTLAVLGTGVDVVYPWSNRMLYQQVIQQGLALSEHPAGTQPDRTHFPRRNRIIAGLCRAVLVMEAPTKSGALITANLANEYGRDVYVLPGSLDNPRSQGCLRLIQKGAQLILSENHLLELLGELPTFTPSTTEQQTAIPANLSPDLESVLRTIMQLTKQEGLEAVQFDQIVQTSGLGASQVSSSLLQLELLGMVAQQPGMRYHRC
jgi:DNA processing protein